jgi:RNA methyltransferase, TrmH family
MEKETAITSKANPRFKELRALLAEGGARRTHTLLLGPKVIEAWASGTCRRLEPELWLRLEGTGRTALEARHPRPALVLGEGLLCCLADAATPPTLALLARLGPETPGPLGARVIVPWGIQDPGNLGAILRSAAAFGFQEALLGPGCADPFSPRALRGGMGAAFLLPLRRVERLPLDGGRWYALDGGEGSLPMARADLSEPVRILVGNEGHGWRDEALPPEVARLAIPMEGVESLNAAVAAGIACFETARRASE